MNNARVAVIIEDDRDIRELLGMILGQAGYEVHAAASGIDGIESVQRHAPALVTVDVGLPDVDGFIVTERIRTFSDSHIIMLTARMDELDTIKAMEAGADEYMAKPFRPRELRARVDALIVSQDAGTNFADTAPVPAADQ